MIRRTDIPAEAAEATHRHYKGGFYRVIGPALHTETQERLLLYAHVWPHPPSLFARPIEIFEGLLADGRPRFAAIDPVTASTPSEMPGIETATHRHYKGGLYRALGITKHTETAELLMAYEHLWPREVALYVRPPEMFEGCLPDGTRRFAPIQGGN